jgi:hypothetical protein
VKDGGGQKLAYVYYEEEPGRRSAAKLLTREREGSRRTSPSCRSYFGRPSRPPLTYATSRPHPRTDIRRPRKTTRFEHNERRHALTIPVRLYPRRTADTHYQTRYSRITPSTFRVSMEFCVPRTVTHGTDQYCREGLPRDRGEYSQTAGASSKRRCSPCVEADDRKHRDEHADSPKSQWQPWADHLKEPEILSWLKISELIPPRICASNDSRSMSDVGVNSDIAWT